MSKDNDKSSLEKLLNSLVKKVAPTKVGKPKESYIKDLDEAEQEIPEVSKR